MKIANYDEAVNFLERELPRSSAQVFTDQAGLKRARQFLKLLGEPQNKLKIIHIAGTSGKGSTAMILSSVLVSHGKKVGMTLSPHVYDIRERCQINNRLISKADFVASLNQLMPVLQKLRHAGNPPSYFEVLLAAALQIFVSKKVDYAILETGLGGTLDATNTVGRRDKLCVLTSIGYDHAEVLGRTLTKIAIQKAGIIQPQNHVIALEQDPKVEAVFTATSRRKQAELEWTSTLVTAKLMGDSQLPELNSQLWGFHQKQNFALAYASANYLAQRDHWQLVQDKLIRGVAALRLPGRFEQLKLNKKIFVLDGAHNQQKLNALLAAAKQKFNTKPFGLLLAMRQSKAIPKLPLAAKTITTTFQVDHQDMQIPAFEPKSLAVKLQKKNPQLAVIDIASPAAVLRYALSSDCDSWLVTGSFFILNDVKQLIKKG